MIIAGVDLEGDDRSALRRLIFGKLSIQLVLLERQGRQFLLAAVTDVRSLLIPTIEGVAILNGGLIEVVVRHCLTADVVGMAAHLFAVVAEDVIVHRVLIPHHADDVGPAVDGDAVAQPMVGVADLVLVPAAVVVPALKVVANGKLVGDVVIRNIQLSQIVVGTGVGIAQRNALMRILGVAVAVNDQVDLLLEGVGHTVTILVIAPQGIDIDIKINIVDVGGVGIDGHFSHRFRHAVTVSKTIDSFVHFSSPADKHDILTIHSAVGGDLITQCVGLRDLLVLLHGRLGGIAAAVDVVHQVIGHMDP